MNIFMNMIWRRLAFNYASAIRGLIVAREPVGQHLISILSINISSPIIEQSSEEFVTLHNINKQDNIENNKSSLPPIRWPSCTRATKSLYIPRWTESPKNRM